MPPHSPPQPQPALQRRRCGQERDRLRTGYTGEKMAFGSLSTLTMWSIFGIQLWKLVRPWVSCPAVLAPVTPRTEAGLPLTDTKWEANQPDHRRTGFLPFLKLNSAWFIGREAFVKRDAERTGVVARSPLTKKPSAWHHGDPVIDLKGRMILCYQLRHR